MDFVMTADGFDLPNQPATMSVDFVTAFFVPPTIEEPTFLGPLSHPPWLCAIVPVEALPYGFKDAMRLSGLEHPVDVVNDAATVNAARVETKRLRLLLRGSGRTLTGPLLESG